MTSPAYKWISDRYDDIMWDTLPRNVSRTVPWVYLRWLFQLYIMHLAPHTAWITPGRENVAKII